MQTLEVLQNNSSKTESDIVAMNLPQKLQNRLIAALKDQKDPCNGVHVGYADATHKDNGYTECRVDVYNDRG